MALPFEGRYAGFSVELRDEGILLITLDRPEQLNSFTAAMKRDLMEALFAIQVAPESRVVIFTGAGRGFCAGDDLATYFDAHPEQARTAPLGERRGDAVGLYGRLRLLSQQLNATVRNLDLITIAAINGACIQSGLSLALCCDFRIVAADAKLGSATLRFGYQPDENGHFLLVQHIGVAKTLDFLLRKRIVSGSEALSLGLVHEATPQADLLPRALALAGELAQGPQTAMRLLKRAIYNAAEMSFAQAADDIASKTAISDHHPDTKEGVAAFRERRSPRFNG